MKRLKNWMHGMLWAVILGLGVYVMAKGIAIVKKDGMLEQEAQKWYAPALTFAAEKGKQKSTWFDLLTKELIPLTAYWESKSGGILEETEHCLIVREETNRTDAAVRRKKPTRGTAKNVTRMKHKDTDRRS